MSSRFDPHRYTSVKSRRNYAGTSPITIASGRKRAVVARHIRKAATPQRLGPMGVLFPNPKPRRPTVLRRAAGDLHHQALRALANRLVGILHGCLKHQTPYNEHTAWAHRTLIDQAAA